VAQVYHARRAVYGAAKPAKPRAVPELRDRWARAVLADPELGDHVTRTAWALREYLNRAGECSVSLGRLESDTGKDRRTVCRHVAELVDRGYLERLPGQGVQGRGGRTTLTRVRIPVDNSVDKSPSCPQLDGQLVTRAPRSSDTCCHPNPSLNPKSATDPAPHGGAVAQDGGTPPRQRELPILGDVQAATPEHVAAHLKRIRANLRKSRHAKRGPEET